MRRPELGPAPSGLAEAAGVREAAALIAALEADVAAVIVGQSVLIRRLLTGLFAAIPFATARSSGAAEGGAAEGCGHVLLEGVPGVAKTLTATTLAQAIAARFQR